MPVTVFSIGRKKSLYGAKEIANNSPIFLLPSTCSFICANLTACCDIGANSHPISSDTVKIAANTQLFSTCYRNRCTHTVTPYGSCRCLVSQTVAAIGGKIRPTRKEGSRLRGCEARRETCSERETGTGKLCEIKWDCHIVTRA